MAESPIPISVVIPVRNSPSQLKLCLEALLTNDLEAVEILVVDDASTDETAEVAQSLANGSAVSLNCVRLAKRSGPAFARNEGARLATHPYVFFLDADIVLPAQSIAWIRETLTAHANRPEVIGVMGVYNETIPWKDFWSNFKNIYVCFLHETTPTVSPYLHTPMLCMRRDVLQSEGGFDATLPTAEDFRLGLKLGSRGYRFIVDRRIKGTHLKRLTPAEILREDARRLRDLLSIQGDTERKRQAYRAHRWSRLASVVLPIPTVILTGASILSPVIAWPAAVSWILFYLCNLEFVRYAISCKGLFFGIRSAAFLFVEMIWAQGVLIYWTIVPRN